MHYEFFTDGSCLGNPGAGGWAYILVINNTVLTKNFGHCVDTTNNRMELMGAIQALESIFDTTTTHDINNDPTQISVVTDSQYVKNGITQWIKNWQKNGWRTSAKTEVKNKDLWMRLVTILDTIKDEKKLIVEWGWVKGHATNHYNNLVDALAQTGAQQISS